MENVLLSWNNTFIDGNGIPVLVQNPQLATWSQLATSNNPALMQSVTNASQSSNTGIDAKYRSANQAVIPNFSNFGLQSFSDTLMTSTANNALYQQAYTVAGQNGSFQFPAGTNSQIRPQYQMTSNGNAMYQPTSIFGANGANASFLPGSFVINTQQGNVNHSIQETKKRAPRKRAKVTKNDKVNSEAKAEAEKDGATKMTDEQSKANELKKITGDQNNNSATQNPHFLNHNFDTNIVVKLDSFPAGCNADGTPIYHIKPPKVEDPILKPYQCEQCHKRFGAMKSLKNHRLIHSDIKPHKCSICGKAFVRADKMKSHEITHLNLKPFECSTCGRRFTRSDKLKIHHRIHTGIKPYHCQFCPKSFTRSDKLRIHERIHTRIKPYPCSICGKCFSRSDKRKMHEQIHSFGPKPRGGGQKKSKKAKSDPNNLTSVSNDLMNNLSSVISSTSNSLTVNNNGQLTNIGPLPTIINASCSEFSLFPKLDSHQMTAAVIAQHNGLFQAATIGQDGNPVPTFFSTNPQAFTAMQHPTTILTANSGNNANANGQNGNSNLAAVMAVALGRQIQQAQQITTNNNAGSNGLNGQNISITSNGVMNNSEESLKMQQQMLIEQLRQQQQHQQNVGIATGPNGQQIIYPIMTSGIDNNLLTTIVNNNNNNNNNNGNPNQTVANHSDGVIENSANN